jgi:hypothetical protein
MFRVRVDITAVDTTLRLDGKLAGPWVDELARCWDGVRAERHGGTVRVDLEGVTFISSAGKLLLRRIHEDGAVLVARDCMTCSIIDEITGWSSA